ncbi:MAG: hypothetical protein P4L88_12410 [Rhodoferax sp.]|nr:hypothetical protein [Rhodoferax sp.]
MLVNHAVNLDLDLVELFRINRRQLLTLSNRRSRWSARILRDHGFKLGELGFELLDLALQFSVALGAGKQWERQHHRKRYLIEFHLHRSF